MSRNRAHLTAAVIAVLCLIPAGFAADDKVATELTQMENDWGPALVKNDEATLNRIMADDWTEVGPDGTLRTKAQAMADLKSGTEKFESADGSDIKVRVFGDTAVVGGLFRVKGTYKGKDASGDFRFTDVFVKRNGKWQAVATQLTAVKPM